MSEELKSVVESGMKDLKARLGTRIDELESDIKSLSTSFNDLAQKQAGGTVNISHNGNASEPSALLMKSAAFTEFAQSASRGAKATIALPASSLLTKAATTGNVLGQMSQGQRLDFIGGPMRRTWLRNLMVTVPTGAASVEFPVEQFVSNAGTQAAAGGVFEGALKPQSTATFDLQTRRVLTIAHFLKASKQVLADAATLSAFLDMRLRYFLELEVERQIISGNGTTELTGFLTATYNDPLTGVVVGDSLIDKVHRAITQLMDGDYMPNAIVMSPTAWQSVRLLKDTEENYIHGAPATGGPATLWGLPVVTTPSMPVNKFAVMDTVQMGVLAQREDANVMLGYEGDDFTRNLVTMLAECRLALSITRPGAIVVGDV